MELDPRTLRSIAAYDQHAEAYQQAFRMSRPLADLRRFAERATRGDVVLDVGCGPASDIRRLSDLGLHPIGVDLSQGALAFGHVLQPRRGLFRAPMHDVPIRESTLGGLWMSQAFAHLPRAQWRGTFAALLSRLGRGPVYFSCYRGEEDLEEVEDEVLGTVFRSGATEDEVEGLFRRHGLSEVSVELRPDPVVDHRRPWVVALGTR